MSTYAQRVSTWGEEWWERFCELAGSHLSDGVRADLADQRAFMEVSAMRKKEMGG
jgi:hypothetical protein